MTKPDEPFFKNVPFTFYAVCSLTAFFGYIALLTAIDDLSSGHLIGVAIDLPLVAALAIGLRIKNAPLALLLTFACVFTIIETSNASVEYRQHAPIAQLFICLFVNRVRSFIRKVKISETAGAGKWLYRRLRVEPVQWQWKQRADTLVNKSEVILNVLSLTVMALIVLALALSGLEQIEILPGAVTGYTVIWLAFFALFVTPLLFLERVSRLTVSFFRANTLDTISNNLKGQAKAAQQRVMQSSEKAKAWVSEGFDEEPREP